MGDRCALFAMNLIMADIEKGYEILCRICPSFCMFMDVVRFKMARIGRIPSFVVPTAVSAFVIISLQHLATHWLWNFTVMLVTLPFIE